MVSSPYQLNRAWSILKILKNQLAFLLIHLLVIASLAVFFNREYSGEQVVLIYLLFTPFFFCSRLLGIYFSRILSRNVVDHNFLIIGRNSLAHETRKFYLMNPGLGYRFKGYIDFENGRIPFESLKNVAKGKNVREVFCCGGVVTGEELDRLIDFGLNSLIKVKVILQPATGQTIELDRFDRFPGIGISIISLDKTFNRFIKRGFDVVFAGLIGFSLLSWLVPIIGILIKLDSPGPVFFIQERKGRNNVPFRCLKFRTMRQNQEADTKQISKNDNRVTRLGSFLRKSSIDELPQFFNVLSGDMSVVGPRPQMPAHYDQYSKTIDAFMSRHYVKSGITGLAQCMGYRGEIRDVTDMENRVRLDRYYIENWSFWLDIKIIFLTVVSLIRGSDKAY